MIGQLPRALEIDGKAYEIRTDYRVVLNIFCAFNDINLSDAEKGAVLLECLYKDIPTNIEEAYTKAIWFLDGGTAPQTDTHKNAKKVMDWEQDEQMIFSAINKIANCETRDKEYIHWWTFLGYFNEIGEGLFSTVVNIRHKKNSGKKLDKAEQEFYAKNKDLIDIKRKFTKDEQQFLEAVNNLFS